MTVDQSLVFGVLGAALFLFIRGPWRYDLVAIGALLALVLADIVPEGEAFQGFGHPAVITVIAVSVVGKALQNSGIIDAIARIIGRVGDQPHIQVGILTSSVAVVSAFINKIGALALFLPVALRMARRRGTAPSVLLMPMAFGSLLGGLTTLIGTPPNIIISSFRARDGGEAFGMFDFTPVGVAVAVAGVLFISLFGWRLIPRRKAPASREELFHVQDYFTEVLVPEGSKLVGTTIRDLEEAEDVELRVLGLVRNGRRLLATSGYEVVRPEDILMVRIDSDQMANLVDSFGLKMVGSEEAGESSLSSEDASLMEVVIMPDSLMVGKTVRVLNLRTLYSINLLAVARQGTQLRARLSNIRLQTGDVLLLHGRTEVLQEQLPLLGCLPLAERGFRLGQPRRLLLALAIFGGV